MKSALIAFSVPTIIINALVLFTMDVKWHGAVQKCALSVGIVCLVIGLLASARKS